MDLNKIGQYNKQERKMIQDSDAEVLAALKALKNDVEVMTEEYTEDGSISTMNDIITQLRNIERFQAKHTAAIQMHVDRVNGEDDEDGK